jgi:TrkA family protein/RyR domain-containing protein
MFRIFASGDVFIVVLVGVLAFALGYWGFWECSFTFVPDPADATKKVPYYFKDAQCHLQNWWHVLIATFNLVRGGGDFTLFRDPPIPSDPWQLVIAQTAMPGIAIFAAIGATLKVFYNKVRRDLHIMMAGRQKNHIIVCGLGDTAMQVVQSIHDLNKNRGLVVIDPLGATINAATCEKLDIPVITGDAKSEGILKIAGFQHARAIVVATGDDATNIEISMRLRDMQESLPINGRNRITIFTEIDNDWLFAKMHSQENHTLGSSDTEVRLFNSYENGARLLIQDMPLPVAPELSAGALVVVGFGKMGRTVALQFLRSAPTAIGQKTRIIVIDRASAEAEEALSGNAPAAREFADFEFLSADLTADKPAAWDLIIKKIADEPLLAVVTCLSQDFDNLFVGMEMRRLLDAHDQYHVPIYVRLQHHNRLGRYAASTEVMIPIADRLKGFGTLESLLSREILVGATIDKLARAWHDEYRKTLPPERHDAPANRPWAELPEFYKMSNRRACDHLPIKLAQAGLRMEEVADPKSIDLKRENAKDPVVVEFTREEADLLAQLEHRRWYIERRMLGWRHGPKRSEAKRLNPLLVEWDKLPEADREQRRAETADLPKILAGAGYVLRRVNVIRAYGDWLAKAGEAMAEAESRSEGRHNVVLAEIDRPEGFAIAERAIRLASTSLWLASYSDPLALARSLKGDEAARFKVLLDKADGWTRCDHLVTNFGSKPGTEAKPNEFPAKGAAPQLRSVT